MSYGAKPDNTTDNTGPFQAALDACSAAHGGEVFIGTGMFRFKGSISIPPGCTLSGTYTVVPSHDLRNSQNPQKIQDGTVLVPLGGRNISGGCDINCTQYFINVGPNGVLRGLVIYYEEQETTETPVPYPWSVYLGDPDQKYGTGSANNAAVTDVELLGAWNGIAAVAAHRHYIARVQGQPLNIGVFVDETYDIGRIVSFHVEPILQFLTPSWITVDTVLVFMFNTRVLVCFMILVFVSYTHLFFLLCSLSLSLSWSNTRFAFSLTLLFALSQEDVHFNPWYSDAHPFVWYQTTHGRAFVMGRSDWEYVFNTFAFGYAIGYHFIERATGSMNGNFLGIGQDLATNASIQVDQSQPFGILITNGEFTAFCDKNGFSPPSCKDPSQVVVSSQNKGAVKLVNSAFWGPSAQIAKIDGKGTVTFSQCHFDSWDNYWINKTRRHNGTAAIQQYGGSLIVTQSEFTMDANYDQPNNPVHFWLGPNAQKTIVSENMIKGKLSIENHGKGKTIVVNNADDSPIVPSEL
jgi:hypothetical protein